MPAKKSLQTKGAMTLNVRAPRGVTVRTQGFFRRAEVRRNLQLAPANSGPPVSTADAVGNL
jgi:hypothetical protein